MLSEDILQSAHSAGAIPDEDFGPTLGPACPNDDAIGGDGPGPAGELTAG
jgi:hypothetical protein